MVAIIVVIPLTISEQAAAAVATQPSQIETTPPPRKAIIIAEMKAAGESNTDADFVELYNPNDVPVDMTGWLLQYRTASTTPDKAWVDKSSTGKDQDTKARLGCGVQCQVVIAAKARFVIASPSANLPRADFVPATNLGFASTGGQIRLVSVDVVHGTTLQEDLLGYGKVSTTGLATATAEGTPAPMHSLSGSLKRTIDQSNELIDTNDNVKDFELSLVATPGMADMYIPPVTSGDQINTEVPEPTMSAEAVGILREAIAINELLPDPVAPYVDAEDEFIELYNKSDEVVAMGGLIITVGASKTNTYTISSNINLEPHEYYAVYAKESGLTLTNSGTNITLAAHDGTVLQSVTYLVAKPGQSWALADNGQWQWTLSPTPGGANTITLAPAVVPSLIKSVSKKTTTAKAPKPPKAAAKPKVPKQPKPKKAKQTTKNTLTTPEAKAKQDATVWVAGGMAMVTSGYLAYDYRASVRRLWDWARPSN